MFKIKLLILLLVSLIFISCTNSENKNYEMKYSLGYITGEYDGLVLKNYLKNYLKSFNLYDENSLFDIKSSISHSSEVYITNIDNTSDRRNVHSNLIIEIVDKVTVIKAGRYEAEVITGAKINIEKGLIIPPVKNNKKPNCIVSKSKNEKALILLIDLFFLSS